MLEKNEEDIIQDESYKKQYEFRKELINLINKYGLENNTNTPDYIIADLMINGYYIMNVAISSRDEWYGVHLEPGNKYFEEEKKSVKKNNNNEI